jgi:SUMO ligase MMS21 Smc5/6 complex component
MTHISRLIKNETFIEKKKSTHQIILESIKWQTGKIHRRTNPHKISNTSDITICPLSKSTINTPVVTKCNHIFSKALLEYWLSMCCVCSICSKKCDIKDLKVATKSIANLRLKIFRTID